MSAGREDIDEAVYTGYSLTSVSRPTHDEDDAFFEQLAREFEVGMQAVRDEIDAAYVVSFQAEGVSQASRAVCRLCPAVPIHPSGYCDKCWCSRLTKSDRVDANRRYFSEYAARDAAIVKAAQPVRDPLTIEIPAPTRSPEVIHAINEALAEYYRQQGTKVAHDPGDEHPDITKSKYFPKRKELAAQDEQAGPRLSRKHVFRALAKTRDSHEFLCACGYMISFSPHALDQAEKAMDQASIDVPCPQPRPVTDEGEKALMRKLESERDMLCQLILPPSRPCYVCGADTGVTRDGVPLCVGCR
jgi:hypothetical protein